MFFVNLFFLNYSVLLKRRRRFMSPPDADMNARNLQFRRRWWFFSLFFGEATRRKESAKQKNELNFWSFLFQHFILQYNFIAQFIFSLLLVPRWTDYIIFFVCYFTTRTCNNSSLSVSFCSSESVVHENLTNRARQDAAVDFLWHFLTSSTGFRNSFTLDSPLLLRDIIFVCTKYSRQREDIPWPNGLNSWTFGHKNTRNPDFD